MKKSILCTSALTAVTAFVLPVSSQVVDFVENTEGPWSDIEATTITAPKVANGQVTLDGSISASEYGGFEGISIVPGENAWILNYAQAKEWSDPDDSSFTFYVAYDDENFYVGVDVKDDVVRSNDPNDSFWKDDAIELVFGPESQYDINTDSVQTLYGGHSYVNYEGRFSEWDEAANAQNARFRWSAAVAWEYGSDKEIFGAGQQTSTGWAVEARFHKSTLEDPDAGVTLQSGQRVAFNIGIDDDDGADLALQYWWASRKVASGFSPDHEFYELLTEEEIESKAYLDPENPAAFWDLVHKQPLSFASSGTLIFGEGGTKVHSWSLY